MKLLLRRVFSLILDKFESGSGPYHYKASHRLALNVMGSLFLGLAIAVLLFAIKQQAYSYFLPIILFGAAGLLSLIIGLLGDDRAVAKIWGSR